MQRLRNPVRSLIVFLLSSHLCQILELHLATGNLRQPAIRWAAPTASGVSCFSVYAVSWETASSVECGKECLSEFVGTFEEGDIA